MSPLLARAALLAALALTLSAPARADESTDGSGDAPAFEAADKNQDGTVTNREQRQYNRAQRRARRAKNGKRGEDEDAAEAADANAADAAQGRSASAMGRASAAAEGLKNSMPSAGAGDLPPGGAAGASSAGARTAPAGSGDPSNPKTGADFALAARSGYAPAFTASGLKLSADGRTVVRADGSPATADDLTRLRFAISTMPAALVRRPDFFARVSPEHFSQLVRGYHDNPGLANTVYKHVGPTAGDRDLVHTESCSKVSGDCNASVEKAEYKKGDFVAPEDLDRMWGALQKELDETEAAGGAGTGGGNGNGAKSERRGGAIAESTFDGRAGNGNDTNGGQGSAASGQGTTIQGSPVALATAAGKRIWRATAAAFGLQPRTEGDIPRGYVFGALGAAAGAAFLFGLMRRRG